MRKGKIPELENFRIITLDYKMEPGYKGNLAVAQQVRFNRPAGKEKPILYCEFELNITGDGDKDFHFNIVGQGRFELEDDQVEAAIKMEESLLDPLVDIMGDRLIKAVADTTSLFGIPTIELKAVDISESKA